MIREYFADEQWNTIMPGIDVCRFSTKDISAAIEYDRKDKKVEIFFCLSGLLTLQWDDGRVTRAGAEDILFLTDFPKLHSVKVQEATEGILFSVDYDKAKERLNELCEAYGGLTLTRKRLKQLMQNCKGCYAVRVMPWNRAFFYTLKKLKEEDQPQYCIMKSFELLYLVTLKEEEGQAESFLYKDYMAGTAEKIKTYMEKHIDEKLTIAQISQHFRISPTLCKTCFSEYYGVPIHRWISDRRMEKAAELLRNTRMSILQIAQEVGYEGVSQFNVIFKRHYGRTPSEFRKMSFSIYF